MHPNPKKRLQLTRETVRTLSGLQTHELRGVVGGITIAGTVCNSKDNACSNGGSTVTTQSTGSACPSGEGIETCTCAP